MRVPVAGAEIHVEEEGRGPAVFVPSGCGSEYYRRSFSPALRRRLRMIYVDMRETGGSSGSLQGATFASMADDLEAVRLALDLERVVVMGHSNHASIALEYGLRHSRRCAAAIAVGGVPDFSRAFPVGMERWEREATPEQKAVLARGQAEFAALPEEMDIEERAVRQYLAFAPLGWRDPHFDAWPLWGRAPRGAAVYFRWIAESATRWNLIPHIGELSVPVLAASGRWDYLCPLELWQEAIGSLPNGRLEIFESSAHNPQLEEAERFDEVVLSFLRHGGLEPAA